MLPLSSSLLIWSKLLCGSSWRRSTFQCCLGTWALPALLQLECSQEWNHTQWWLLKLRNIAGTSLIGSFLFILWARGKNQNPWNGEHKLGDREIHSSWSFLWFCNPQTQTSLATQSSSHLHWQSQPSALPCSEWVLGYLFTPQVIPHDAILASLSLSQFKTSFLPSLGFTLGLFHFSRSFFFFAKSFVLKVTAVKWGISDAGDTRNADVLWTTKPQGREIERETHYLNF